MEDFDQLNIYIQNLELCFEHSKSVSHFENRSFNHIFDEAEFLTRNSISEVLKKQNFLNDKMCKTSYRYLFILKLNFHRHRFSLYTTSKILPDF